MDAMSVEQASHVALSCDWPDNALDLVPLQTVQTRVTIRNYSDLTLDSDGPHPLYIAYSWMNADSTPLRLDAGRVRIVPPVRQGESREMVVPVAVPEIEGSCIVRITVVQEWVRWFDEPAVRVFCEYPCEIPRKTWWTAEARDSVPFGNIEALNHAIFQPTLSHRGRSRPLMLHVETVNTCNLSCIICPYSEMTRARETMPMPLFQKIVADYCDMGGGDVVLTPQVGDVFLDKLLLTRIRYLRQQPDIRSIGFVTNAVNARVFSDSDLDEIVNACDRINISVYGLNEEEYAVMTRRPNRYVRMVDSIRRMAKVNRTCQLVIALRLLKNYEQSFIRKWMISSFDREFPFEVLTTFGNWAGAMDTSKPLPFDAVWADAAAAERLEEGGPCGYPILHLKVLVNGDVQFCSCVDYNGNAENNIGNVKDESLSDIYNGPSARRLWREGLTMCNGCTHRKPIADLVRLASGFAHPIRSLGV